jgi:hypothetical protein
MMVQPCWFWRHHWVPWGGRPVHFWKTWLGSIPTKRCTKCGKIKDGVVR